MKRILIASTYITAAIVIYHMIEWVRRSNMLFEPKVIVMALIAACAGYMIGKAGQILLR